MHDPGGLWRHFAGKKRAELLVIAWIGAKILKVVAVCLVVLQTHAQSSHSV